MFKIAIDLSDGRGEIEMFSLKDLHFEGGFAVLYALELETGGLSKICLSQNLIKSISVVDVPLEKACILWHINEASIEQAMKAHEKLAAERESSGMPPTHICPGCE